VLSIRVDVDTKPVLAILGALQAPALNQVAALALTDTAENAQVALTKQLRPLTGLPSREIKKSMIVAPARPERLRAAVIVSGRPIPLIRFGARESRKGGVSVRIGGKVETYTRAFIATMPGGGHRGVFERKTKARLPIRELWGPSLPGMVRRSDVLPPLVVFMNDRLVANLHRQLDRRVRRDAGKAKRAA
jgi:Prophage minor tail protein Z (GPZ)